MVNKNSKNVTVVTVQYNPIFKDPSSNIKILEELLLSYKKEDKIDLILFPEMTLTGYCFDSKEEIQDFLEDYNDEESTTAVFARNIALQLEANVLIGYPEKEDDKNYNSAMLVNRQGKKTDNFRKTHLYVTDKVKNLTYIIGLGI